MRRCNEHTGVCGIDHGSDLLRPQRHRVRMSPAGPDARKATTRLFGCPSDEVHECRRLLADERRGALLE